MTDKELAVLELLQAMDSCDLHRIAAAYAVCFPGEKLSGFGLDTEAVHSIADSALCTLLPPEIVAAFDKLEKWYA